MIWYNAVQYTVLEHSFTFGYSIGGGEEQSYPCVECEVLRELLLHTDQLIPPPLLGFERFRRINQRKYKMDRRMEGRVGGRDGGLL